VTESERVRQLYTDGYAAATYPASMPVPGSFGTEEERRGGGKWETIQRFRKRMRATSLRNPRLDLSYIAREGGLLARTTPPIDYSLLVSIRARGDSDLYDRARAQFPTLTPINLRPRPDIRV
jgi:hypothetical protein